MTVLPAVTQSRLRRLLQPAGVLAATTVAAAVLHLIDPNEPGSYPTCPFLALTGWFCPGCGSLRALHALTHFDVPTALARNPLATIALAGLAAWFVVWTRRRWRGRERETVAPPWLTYGLAVVVIGYGVLRNVPGLALLSPA